MKFQQLLFKKENADQDAATRARFCVVHLIVKHGKPSTDDEMFKDCMIAAAAKVQKKNKNKKNVSLSTNTDARKVDNIAENKLNCLAKIDIFSFLFDPG